MTSIIETIYKCAVCGKTSKHGNLLSTNLRGSFDLDTRPPEMKRSTIDYWVQRCPSCGYCAPKISELLSQAPEIIKSDFYQKQLESLCYCPIKRKLSSKERGILSEHQGKAKKSPSLTVEEGKKLTERIKKGDKEAAMELIQANSSLIITVSRRYITRAPKLNLLELIRIVNSGLVKAARYYNWDKNYKFSDYADWWVNEAIKKYLVPQHSPRLANYFLCWSLIEKRNGNFVNAGQAAHCAAWVCDDFGNEKGSRKCRKKAIELFHKATEHGQSFAGDSETEKVMLIDLLRCSGQFKLALKACKKELLREKRNKTSSKVLQFQKTLIEKSDFDCHTIAEAMKENN